MTGGRGHEEVVGGYFNHDFKNVKFHFWETPPKKWRGENVNFILILIFLPNPPFIHSPPSPGTTHEPDMEHSSILQGIMSEISAAMAGSQRQRMRNAAELAALHGDTSALDNADSEYMEMGRRIFSSLRMTSANHLPRLQREVMLLLDSTEFLCEMAWRECMTYRQRHTCLTSIDHLSSLADLMIQTGIEYHNKDKLSGRVMPTTLAEQVEIIEKMQDVLDIMQAYRESTLESVDMAGRELSRNRRERQENQNCSPKDHPGLDSGSDSDQCCCVICCHGPPVGEKDAWITCLSCQGQFERTICFECTQRLFKQEGGKNVAVCPFCRDVLTFKNE